MATIQSTIQLYDSFSPVMRNVLDSVNLTIVGVEQMQRELGENFNTNALREAQESILQAGAAMVNVNERIIETERHINNNTSGQNQFNNSLRNGNNIAGNLVNTIKRVAGAYLTMQGVQKVLNLSDSMASTNARLEIMNEMNGSLQTQQELQDAIFVAAERSRTSYNAMASTVSKLGTQATKSFNGTDEVLAFTELLNKSFVVGGASATEQAAAMYQLTQAMSAGKLQGDEYRSIIENAPQLATAIEDYMINVQHAEGSMKEWASEGLLTANVIKAALFSSANEIEERFEKMPMTFGQIWTSISNRALMAFQPFLQRLNDIANSDRFNTMVNGAIGALTVLGIVATEVIDLMTSGAAFICDNWSFIAPIVGGVAFAVGLYTATVTFNSLALKANNTIKRMAAVRSAAHGGAISAERLATLGMTEAQLKLNAAIYASPITWIIAGILLVIAAIYIVNAVINKVCDVSISATGMIVGLIFYIAAALTNTGLLVNNVFFACKEAGIAVAENIYIAFHNSIERTKGIFYGFAAVALKVISVIAAKLSVLPFVTFDAKGLSVAASHYASKYAKKSVEAFGNIKEYNDVMAAWNKGYGTYGAEDMLDPNAEFDRGYEWGKSLADKVKGIFSPEESKENEKSKDYSEFLNGIADNTGATAGNTEDIKDTLEITDEDLKYLRDIAEREVIDRTVLKSVTIDMSGMTNKVENMQDLDGISTYLAKSLKQQMEVSMEGA